MVPNFDSRNCANSKNSQSKMRKVAGVAIDMEIFAIGYKFDPNILDVIEQMLLIMQLLRQSIN